MSWNPDWLRYYAVGLVATGVFCRFSRAFIEVIESERVAIDDGATDVLRSSLAPTPLLSPHAVPIRATAVASGGPIPLGTEESLEKRGTLVCADARDNFGSMVIHRIGEDVEH